MTPNTDQAVQPLALSLDQNGSGSALLLQAAIEIAHRYPRDPEAILAQAIAGLDKHPEAAEKAIYSIPYEDRRRNRTVKVEGLSVRTAETLAALWGHLRVGVRISGEDKDGYDLEAVAWDMQSNFQQLLPFRVSKWEKSRDGKTFALDERRMLQSLQAAVSKVKRNVVLSMLPTHVKLAYERRVREILAKGPLNRPAAPDTIKMVEDAFAQFEVKPGERVTKDMLEARVGKPTASWLGSDIADLRGLYTAIEDGQVSAAEVFGPSEPEPEAKTGPAKVTVTPETIQQGTAAGQDEAPPQATAASAKRDKKKTESERPAPIPIERGTGPAAQPAALGEQEFLALLDTIAQAESDDLDKLVEHLGANDGALKRASKIQKSTVLQAVAARRADL